jgi:hypothetical protein
MQREPFTLSRLPRTLRISVFSSLMRPRRERTGLVALPRISRLSIFQAIKVSCLTLNLKTFSASLSPRTLASLSIRSLSQGLITQLTSATLVRLSLSTEKQTIDAWLMRLSPLMLMIWLTPKTLTMLSKLHSCCYQYRFQGIEISRPNIYNEIPTVGYQGFKSVYKPGTVRINHRKDPFFNLNALRPRI